MADKREAEKRSVAFSVYVVMLVFNPGNVLFSLRGPSDHLRRVILMWILSDWYVVCLCEIFYAARLVVIGCDKLKGRTGLNSVICQIDVGLTPPLFPGVLYIEAEVEVKNILL